MFTDKNLQNGHVQKTKNKIKDDVSISTLKDWKR